MRQTWSPKEREFRQTACQLEVKDQGARRSLSAGGPEPSASAATATRKLPGGMETCVGNILAIPMLLLCYLIPAASLYPPRWGSVPKLHAVQVESVIGFVDVWFENPRATTTE